MNFLVKRIITEQLVHEINATCRGNEYIPTAYSDGSGSEISIYPTMWLNSSLSPGLFVFFHTQEASELRKILTNINAACNAYGLSVIAYSDINDKTSEVKLSPVVQFNTELHPNLLVFFHIDERIVINW
jgi:hypothetical protein